MFKVNSCGTTSLTGLSNLSMTGPTGMNGPVGIKSRVQNYITAPMNPYTHIITEPVPVNVDSNPEIPLELNTITPFKGRFAPKLVKNMSTPPSILNVKRIKKMASAPPHTRSIFRDDIPVGQNQPIQGLLTYTLGPLQLTRYEVPEPQESYLEIRLPFQVEFDSVLYNRIYIYSRSYITFGEKYELTPAPGYEYTAQISGYNPPIQSILIGASIGVANNFYYGLENDSSTFRVRYEGYRDLIYNIPHVWEVVFYRNNPSQIDISAEIIDFQGLTGLSSGYGLLSTFDLTSNSGVTCTPVSTEYKDILLTTPNISTQSSGGDTLEINIEPLYPLQFYSEYSDYFGFITKTDKMVADTSNLIITSPFDMSLLSSQFISLYGHNGISLRPTFESTDGPGGYVSITNPNITISEPYLSNIEIVDGYCKLIL